MIHHLNYRRNTTLAAACAALFTILPVNALAEETPLAHARTIQVQTKYSIVLGEQTSPDSKEITYTGLLSVYDTTVRIQQPDKIKAIVKEHRPFEKKKLIFSGVYAVSGKNETIYHTTTNKFLTRPIVSGDGADELRGASGVDLILDRNPLAATAKKGKRTITRTTLDGRPMILRTDIFTSMKDEEGNVMTPQEEVWFDAATKLPVRDRNSFQYKGKLTPSSQVDYSEWVFDKPIAADQITFAPPSKAEKVIPPPPTPPVGSAAPDFEAVTPEGKTVHLSDYKGKVVVVDFWATWCGPCQAAMPHLENVYQQLKDQNAQVLAVCIMDKKEEYDQWRTKNVDTKYHFPVVFDAAKQTQDRYHLRSIPQQFVIGPDGLIMSSESGYEPGSHELEKTLRTQGLKVTDTPD
jgi:thiol-disulfide isomerase/thioredoxin